MESFDGSAKEREDYQPVDEVLTFETGEREKQINVRIIDDSKWEPEEEFFLKISLIGVDDDDLIQLGRLNVLEVTIIDDDSKLLELKFFIFLICFLIDPGVITFEKRGILVKESAGAAELHIIRRGGSDGEATVQWRTIDETAINGRDYFGGSGEITFKHLEVRQVCFIHFSFL